MLVFHVYVGSLQMVFCNDRSSAVRLQEARACDLSTDHWALQGHWAISEGTPAVRKHFLDPILAKIG